MADATVREFKLISAGKQTLDLMDKDTFGNSPTGLGVSMGNTYLSGQGTFVKDESNIEQNKIGLDIMMGYTSGSPYSVFYNRVLPVLNDSPLVLQYTIPGVGDFFRDVALGSIEKTEIDKDSGLLKTPVVLEALTPWYSWKTMTSFTPEYIQGTGKVYGPITSSTEKIRGVIYPYVYGSNTQFSPNNLHITNNSIYLGSQSTSGLEVNITATPETGPLDFAGWTESTHQFQLDTL